MFKKLKDKLTEEVKSSPQRLQLLTQSVSDRLQNTQAPSDENFFSIGEEDTSTSPTNVDQGFSSVALVSPTENRQRRSSNTSIASDISFLPRYESGSLYHLQSDLDASASEFEDNASSSSQLGHLSKEQIYSAFQKSQMRYHKYRGRYTDLSRHYKDLERENAKMKSVLVETQDKAIRRVTELKEQCSLEQKAKAHLEGALRDEIDEYKIKIQTLETKINLLQTVDNADRLENLPDEAANSERLQNLTKHLNDARSEIENLNAKIQELKANSIIFQTKEQEYKNKIVNFEKEIAQFYEREKENNLKLAQNKMELHNELLSKDSEINMLKKELETIQVKIEKEHSLKPHIKIENLQTQNNKLIERVENLTLRCNNLESELLKVEKYKLEIEELTRKNEELKTLNEDQTVKLQTLKTGLSNCHEIIQKLSSEKDELSNIIEDQKQHYEREIANLRESAKKGLLSLEGQMKIKLSEEFLLKEEELKKQFMHKIEELSTNNNTSKEIQLQLIEKDNLIKQLNATLADLEENLTRKEKQYRTLENDQLNLIDDGNILRSTLANLEKDFSSANVKNEDVQSYEDRIERLQASIKTLQDEVAHLTTLCEHKEQDNVALEREVLKLEKSNQEIYHKLRLLEEKDEMAGLDSNECSLLEMKLKKLEEERRTLLNSFEEERKVFNEVLRKNESLKFKDEEIQELQERNTNLLSKITTLKWFLAIKESKIVQLGKTKVNLEQEIKKLEEQVRIFEEKNQAVELDKTECALLKVRLQKLEEERDNLLKSFEKERGVYEHDIILHHHHETATTIVDKENEEISNSLIKENLILKRVNEELLAKVRLFEEKKIALELETSESKLLELKLQKLEEEKKQLIDEFEMEREMFNKMLEENRGLKIKEEQIADLEENIISMEEKIIKLREYLEDKEAEIVRLNKVKLGLEQEVVKFKENARINEEREESVSMADTECHLLQMKVQNLEKEIVSLVKSFELERQNFEDTHNKNSKLMNLNTELKAEKDLVNSKLKKALEKNEVQNEEIADLNLKVRNLHEINESLKKDLGDRENKIKQLLEAIEKLNDAFQNQSLEYNGLLERSKTLEEDIKKVEHAKEEQQRKHDMKILELEELKKDVDAKDMQIKDINHALTGLERNYNSEKENFIMQIKEVEGLQNRVVELEGVEHKSKALENQKKLVETELEQLKVVKSTLKQLESDKKALEAQVTETNELLSKKTEEYKFKIKEFGVLEQQFALVRNENESLKSDFKDFRQKIDDLNIENNNLQVIVTECKDSEQGLVVLKKKNDILQNECDKLNQEISELKVRINQLSLDNRNITEENNSLSNAMEEHKVNNEFLQSEKVEFQAIRTMLETEKLELERVVEELGKSKPVTENSTDLLKIQQDFYEIKDKCDNLHIENKNLKSEYTKLEERCSEFVNVKNKLETQVSDLEHQCNELLHEKQLLQEEIQEFKMAPVQNNVKLDNLQLLNHESTMSDKDKESYLNEIETLRDKLTKYKSLDLTNKSSIEFYENELHKLKTNNEKLNRRLDETLVTLHHCADLSDSTEIEYLKNVLYNYMLGKESMVLARVIAAVCKFDPEQTEAVLQKEQQKQTLLGQLGIL